LVLDEGYYSVPDPSVLELRFTPNPDVYTAYTFTDVETLLAD
jgi:glycine cleavage system pyridoxal-binding protein P